MDDIRLISAREVCALTSLSRTSLWRIIRAGHFPRPIAVGYGIRKAFVAAEVQAWIEARIAERDASREAA